jgi:DNA-binding PadR family transcriptional regulator
LADNPLPLTEATFYILLSLSDGRKHGYALLKDIFALSEASLQLSSSTLYSALVRLHEQGLIARLDDQPSPASGPGLPRKSYELTGLGRRTLQAELTRLRRLAQLGQQLLGQEPFP